MEEEALLFSEFLEVEEEALLFSEESRLVLEVEEEALLFSEESQLVLEEALLCSEKSQIGGGGRGITVIGGVTAGLGGG